MNHTAWDAKSTYSRASTPLSLTRSQATGQSTLRDSIVNIECPVVGRCLGRAVAMRPIGETG